MISGTHFGISRPYNDLQAASNISAQRATFQQATSPFQKLGIGTAANTEDFLREKIARDPNAAGVKQMAVTSCIN